MHRLALRTALVILLAPGLAGAQPMRTLVVPADAEVAIPPRGRSLPATPAQPMRLPPAMITAPEPPPAPPQLLAASPLALGAVPGLLLPLAAAALLGGSLAGGGSSGSAPATTR